MESAEDKKANTVLVRHPRLYAFYNSKVINAMMITLVDGILLWYITDSVIMIACAALALLLAIGYALWLWIKRPQRIVINTWLSDMSGWFLLYYLCVSAMKAQNVWWYIFPAVCGVLVMFVDMVRRRDAVFDIPAKTVLSAS
ncbi:MAG: hypothetical protein NC043_08205 [Muribaculaceae bacterium]|nr:hypothetical protein [Muribaculaceae bacterium]